MNKKNALVLLVVGILFLSILVIIVPRRDKIKPTCSPESFSCIRSETNNEKNTLTIVYYQYALGKPEMDQKVTTEEVEIREGETITFSLFYGYEVTLFIEELTEESISVHFVSENMGRYDFFSQEGALIYAYEEDGCHWQDILYRNECYHINSLSIDGGVPAKLIYNIDECEKKLICGWGKMLYMWESGDGYEIGVIKDRRLIILNSDEIYNLKNKPQSEQEVLDYMYENECGKCLNINIILEEDAGVRHPTTKEFERIKELYPLLPFCENKQTVD